MSQNRMAMYAALAAAGAGGYYMYQAGGSTRTAKEDMRSDAMRLQKAIPHGEKATQAGERVGQEGMANIDEAVNNARTEGKPDERIPEASQKGISRIDQIRHDTAAKMGTTVDKLDRNVENKANEAKGKLSGWFGAK